MLPVLSVAPLVMLGNTIMVALSALSVILVPTKTCALKALASHAQLVALAVARGCKHRFVRALVTAGPGEEEAIHPAPVRQVAIAASTLSQERLRRAQTVPREGIKTRPEAEFARPVPKGVTVAREDFKKVLVMERAR